MTFVPYNLNIPNPPNNPSVDVTPMQQNTNAVQTLLAIDHFGFNDNQGGSHQKASLAETNLLGVPTLPSGLLGAGYETLYATTKATGGAFGTAGELYFVRGGSATQIQLTGPGTPTPGNNGYTFLPGGILIQWGFRAAISNGTDVTFPVAFPNNVYNIQVAQYDAASNGDERSVSVVFNALDRFTIRITTLGSSPSGSSCNINYIAVGN